MAQDERRLERIENKIDKIGDHMSSIDVTLSGQHESLKEHIRRTELLERELAPIKKHVNMVDGALKMISIIAALAAILECIHLMSK